MPANDSPHVIVARFLLVNGYHETLQAFLAETGLQSVREEGVTLEAVLDAQRSLPESIHFNNLQENGTSEVETRPFPDKRCPVLALSSSVLNLGLIDIGGQTHIIITTADKALTVWSLSLSPPACTLKYQTLHTSPILSTAVLDPPYVVIASMDGRVLVVDITNGNTVQRLNSHAKYAVRVVVDSDYVASAGYDRTIHVYERRNGITCRHLGVISLASNPEAVVFTQLNGNTALLVSRRDSSTVVYYELPTLMEKAKLDLGGVFTPCDLAIDPVRPDRVGIVTNDVPIMQLTILNQRPSLSILQHMSTGSPQDQFSTPRLCFRPLGGGLWVNGDDGMVRGLDPYGKIACELPGHEGRVKAICSGVVQGKEFLITGGMADKAVIIWT